MDTLASGITDKIVSNVATVEEAKDEVLDYVFSRIDISRVRMTLALWDRNWWWFFVGEYSPMVGNVSFI